MRTNDYVARLMSIASEDDYTKSVDVRIAQTMLAHLNELGNIQNQELAAMCYVDPATVSRFVRSLGFLKYGEFKAYFKEYNEIHDVDYYYQLNKLPTNQEAFESTVQAISASYQMLDEKKLDEVVSLISFHREILIGGDRYSQLIAQNLQMKLLSLGYYAKTYSDVNLQYENLKNSKGLFILFSASASRSRAMLDLAKKHGWKIILVTRNPKAKGDVVVLYDHQHLSTWSVNSVNDFMCMAMIVDQIILKIASCAINKK